jgi:hypothetical protein
VASGIFPRWEENSRLLESTPKCGAVDDFSGTVFPDFAAGWQGCCRPLCWSPDGNYVYGIRGREIVKVGLASPNQPASVVNLSGDVINYADASVSPDGRDVVVSTSEAKSDVWVMENFDPSVVRTTK